MRKLLLLFLCVCASVVVQAQGQYWLFESQTDNSKGNNGDKAIVGATLYKSVQVNGKSWTEVPEDQREGKNWNITSFTDDEKEQHESEVNPNNYYKVPVKPITYYRLAMQWTPVEFSETNNQQFINSDGWVEATINEDHLNDGGENQCVRFATGEYDYYVATMSSYQVSWEGPVTSLSDEQKAAAIILDTPPDNNTQTAEIQQGYQSGGNGTWYYKVPKYHYYKKMKSWSGALTELPEGETAQFKDWSASDLANHVNDNTGYYALASDFAYYLVENNNYLEWQKQESYSSDYQYQLIATYATKDEMEAPTEKDKYCTVGGSTYTKDESSWIEDSPATVATSWDETTGTLTIGTDETRSIQELMTVYGITKDNVNKVVFADGAVWQNGVLTPKNSTYEADETALKDAEFTISEVKIGNYVSVIDGVTVITIPEDEANTGVIGNLHSYGTGSGKLTKAEKQVICKATDMKLVGPFSDDEWLLLATDAGSDGPKTSYIEYQTVEEQKTDDEGNLMYDEDGNPVMHTVTREIEHEGESYIHNLDLTQAIISDGSSNQGCRLQNKFGHVEKVLLPTNSNYKKVPDSFAPSTQIQSITIPSNVEVIGKSAFAGCADLTNVDFSNATNLKEFQESAFEQCNITGDLVIPASVEVIGEKAFKNSIHITSVTFPKGSQLYGEGHGIGAYAFWMDGEHNDLDNVYVLEDENLINCDVMAFDYDNTDGQTRMSTVKTRLHYPPSYYYYYVGEWKSRVNGGKVEGHDDLLALRTAIETGSAHIVGGDDVVLTEEEKQWVNGFQKFVSSGIPVTFDTQWRTYSDVVNIRVPAYANQVADVYIVCGYEASEEVNQGRVLLKQMHEGDIIPAHTGIIIKHYVTDGQNGGVLTFPHVQSNEEASLDAESTDWRKPYRFVREGDSRKTYHENAHEFSTGIETRLYKPKGAAPSGSSEIEGFEDGYPNYLEFLDCKGKQRVIYNAENDHIIDWPTLEMGSYSGQKVTYRNFLFGNGVQIQNAKYQAEHGNEYNKETNPEGFRDYTDANGWDPAVHGQMGWGFFRCMSRYYKVNSKAFLHFPVEVFDKAKGGATTAIVNANVIGAKPMGLLIIDSDMDVVTGIDIIPATNVKEMAEGTYYTLQGVKVNAPKERGIYIHNGKKVVVK